MSQVDEARVRQTVLAIPTNVDIRAFEAVEPLFARQVSVDYTSLWGGEPQAMTPAELVGAWRALVPGFDATWHEISDLRVTVDEHGERATATCAVDGRHWLGGRVWRPIGRYAFWLSWSDGRWRVTRMTFSVEREEGERALVEEARGRASGFSLSAAR